MRLHHLALRTADVAELERFYAGTLGLTAIRRQPHSVWLDAGGTILMLEARAAGEPAIEPGTRELVAFAIEPGAPVIDRLREAGVAIEDRTAFTLYVRDPDGRRVGLSSYPTPLETPP